MIKLSEQYYDAILTGNTTLAEQLKLELNEQTKTTQRSDRITPIQINTVLNNDNSPAIQIYEFLNKKYKEEWWDWEIETLERMLWIDFGSVISENNIDKIQAVKLLINNQRPFLDWFYFNQVAVALGGAIADFNTLRSPSPGMAVAAMQTMQKIRPEENFSRDVKKYVSLILINDGIYTPAPSVSSIIKEEFEHLISQESKDRWKPVFERSGEMLMAKNYGDSDDPVDVQARRLLITEEASSIYGG